MESPLCPPSVVLVVPLSPGWHAQRRGPRRNNVPLGEVISWFRSFDGRLIVEFVEPHNPMATRLLGNKPAGMFPHYNIEAFERLLEEQFTVDRKEALPSGSRTLFSCTPR
jgi:hypothetical protein